MNDPPEKGEIHGTIIQASVVVDIDWQAFQTPTDRT
jgi:hypothetical protein